MATVNLGRIKPVFRGAYSGSTAYVVDDIVTHSDETYICIQAHGAGTQAVTQTAYWTKMAAKGADGTNVATTLTTQGDLLYRDGSGLQRLGAGTSGQVLQTGGSGANPSWGTVSSDYVLLNTSTISGASAVVADNVFTNDYKFYQIKLEGVYANSDGEVQFNWRYGGASGASSTSSTYRQNVKRVETTSTSVSEDVTLRKWDTNYAVLFQSMESGTATKTFNATIDVYNPFKNSWTYWNYRATGWDNSGAWLINIFGGGVQADVTSITGISINAEAGQWSGGTMKIYGLK